MLVESGKNGLSNVIRGTVEKCKNTIYKIGQNLKGKMLSVMLGVVGVSSIFVGISNGVRADMMKILNSDTVKQVKPADKKDINPNRHNIQHIQLLSNGSNANEAKFNIMEIKAGKSLVDTVVVDESEKAIQKLLDDTKFMRLWERLQNLTNEIEKSDKEGNVSSDPLQAIILKAKLADLRDQIIYLINSKYTPYSIDISKGQQEIFGRMKARMREMVREFNRNSKDDYVIPPNLTRTTLREFLNF